MPASHCLAEHTAEASAVTPDSRAQCDRGGLRLVMSDFSKSINLWYQELGNVCKVGGARQIFSSFLFNGML